MSAPLLEARGLTKTFRSGGRSVVAADNVSLTIMPGETLGLVGPSGSGKSTVARMVLRLIEPDAGQLLFAGTDFLLLRGEALRRQRRRIQMVFQDSLAAFNPRASVLEALSAPLRIHGLVERHERPAAVAALLGDVGLAEDLIGRQVHSLSGGQRQRVAIARALATRPELIVLDESVSALDVSVRRLVLDLLTRLQRERGLAYLFVSHDIAVVGAVSHRIAVMDNGHIVEEGQALSVVAAPQSETGRALVAATPRLEALGLRQAELLAHGFGNARDIGIE